MVEPGIQTAIRKAQDSFCEPGHIQRFWCVSALESKCEALAAFDWRGALMQLPTLGLKFTLIALGATLVAAAAHAQPSVALTPDVASATDGLSLIHISE